mgnify:CR=1 FL=1
MPGKHLPAAHRDSSQEVSLSRTATCANEIDGPRAGSRSRAKSAIRRVVARAGTVTTYREPLVGFVSAGHPQFADLRRVAEPTHMLPQDLLPGARHRLARAAMGLTGITFFWPYVGLLPLAMLSAVMMFTNFFSSRYLNQITASEQRATVLSFKGLSYNLAYGMAGLLYALLLAFLRRHPAILAAVGDKDLEALVFEQSFLYLPGYFILMLAVLIMVARFQLKRHTKPPKTG